MAMKKIKSKREQLFESIAALIFGTAQESPYVPNPGWKADLARQMGMNKNAVTDTLRQDHGAIFDAKLADFVSSKRIEMVHNAIALELEEEELRGKGQPVKSLWIVEIFSNTEDSRRLVWATHPGEVAVFYMSDLLHPHERESMSVTFTGSRASARAAGNRRVHVRHARKPVVLETGDLEESKELIKRVGRTIDDLKVVKS